MIPQEVEQLTGIELVLPETVSLKDHQDVNESWLRDRLVENPELLGLGDLAVRDRERSQPSGGRLDLLLEDVESRTRYEVELQLGSMDESHIIRTIEYWDIERRRYPQYDHIAVIVAEDVTSRFLNVISLFNGSIPLIAIRLQCVKVNGAFSIVSTRVVDVIQLGTDEQDEGVTVDRSDWERKSSSRSLELMNRVLEMINEIQPGASPRYTQHYIGLEYTGQARNFVMFKPRKSSHLVTEIKVPQDEELTAELEDAGLTLLTYDRSFGLYRVRLVQEDLQNRRKILSDLIGKARNLYFKI